ncbi:MAG: TetR/AcrR family transcriptional regulator [Actinomycetota bacterium]|nr:TetR/AcrR family transcriptional regulator [Actinomycetota bacterium]
MANRDPEATKARILAAALREFSAKGISGARVDAIAARAKVNKRMLYYYFESKEELFREILRRRLHERSATLHTSSAADPDRLADRQGRLSGETQYSRLLMWEALETNPDRPVNEEIRREFFRGWVNAVEEEQRAGTLPADLDAAQLVLSEICLTMGPMVLPQLTHLITGMSVRDPEFLAARQKFLRALGQRIDEPPAVAREVISRGTRRDGAATP